MTAVSHPAGQPVPEWLARQAADHPEALAVIDAASGIRWTYGDLDARATDLAGALAAAGVGPGDRVAALLANGPWYVVLVHALIRLRAVLVPINLRLAPAEIAWQLGHARAMALIFDQITAELAGAATAGAPVTSWPLDSLIVGSGQAPMGARKDAPRIDLAAVQCIMFTSGTTGRPKGVLLTHGNHWWSAMASALHHGLHEDDRWLICLPLFHIGGLAIVMRAVIYGIPVVFPPAGPDRRRFDPLSVAATITEERVTLVSVVTVMLRQLLDIWADQPHPPALRRVLLGGGPAPRALLEECALRALPVTQSFGMTETASQVVTLAPEDALRKLGSAGRPLPPNEVRIDLLREGGEEGEILVRGPSVTIGYLGPDGDLLRPLPAVDEDDWLHTGDIGYLDDGYLYVLDRRADLIISGGENISPAEVEAVLLSHPEVAEAGVYGVPDERWGQKVAAAVVARAGAVLVEEELRAYCRQRLAGYKVPGQVRIVSVLPRNAAGKLLRRRLRDEARVTDDLLYHNHAGTGRSDRSRGK